jgi:hypothetical protein
MGKVDKAKIDISGRTITITDPEMIRKIVHALGNALLDFKTEHMPRPASLTVHHINGKESTIRIGYDPRTRFVYLPCKLCSRELFNVLQPYLSSEKSNAQPAGKAVSSS